MFEYLPGLQELQLQLPKILLCVPAGHFVHEPDLLLEYLPLSHLLHDDAPEPEYFPHSQLLHDVLLVYA